MKLIITALVWDAAPGSDLPDMIVIDDPILLPNIVKHLTNHDTRVLQDRLVQMYHHTPLAFTAQADPCLSKLFGVPKWTLTHLQERKEV